MSRTVRLIQRLVLWLAFLPVAAAGQQAADASGCYVFTRPYFTWIVTDGPTLTSFRAESRLVRLLPAPLAHQTAQPGARQLVVPGLSDSSAARDWYRYSNWHSYAGDSIGVSWWNGLFGTSLRLRVFPDSLVGTSSFSSDVGDPSSPRSHSDRPAVARRTACPQE